MVDPLFPNLPPDENDIIPTGTYEQPPELKDTSGEGESPYIIALEVALGAALERTFLLTNALNILVNVLESAGVPLAFTPEVEQRLTENHNRLVASLNVAASTHGNPGRLDDLNE